MSEQDPQSHSELASFGEELRREREIRGISLKEIADATKISKRFLDAIERNDHKTLPAPVFTRGFVREYARYLGLNIEEMVNRYNFAAAGDDRIEKPVVMDRTATPPPELPSRPQVKRGIPAPYARIDRGIYILVLIVLALAGASYWAIKFKRAHAEAEARTETVTPVTSPARAAPAAAAVTPAVNSAAASGRTEAQALQLTVNATADSWIDLEADGKTLLSDELTKGSTRTFSAAQQFRFRTIGNAGGLVLQLNGAAITALGGDGEVVHNLVLDREYLRQHPSAPRSGP